LLELNWLTKFKFKNCGKLENTGELLITPGVFRHHRPSTSEDRIRTEALSSQARIIGFDDIGGFFCDGVDGCLEVRSRTRGTMPASTIRRFFVP
jgi:hypothetical protein